MSVAINVKNVTKIRKCPSMRSEKYKWFNKPKGFIFSKPSGIYLTVTDGSPALSIGVLATNYEDAIQFFDKSQYRVCQNEDGSLTVYENACVKVWHVGVKESDVYWCKDDEQANQFYNLIISQLEKGIKFENED